jgi:hypothetical protein
MPKSPPSNSYGQRCSSWKYDECANSSGFTPPETGILTSIERELPCRSTVRNSRPEYTLTITPDNPSKRRLPAALLIRPNLHAG